MSTHALPRVIRPGARRVTAVPAVTHLLWLMGGLALGFSIPFVLADVLELNRDLYYGLYGATVIGYVGAWVALTGQLLRRLVSRRLGLAVALGVVAGAVLVVMIYGTEDSTPRPDGIEFAAAIIWRGVVYGAVDGVLLSAFPILAVFAAFAGSRLRTRRTGTALVGLIALVASLAMTTVYHVGYSDFRSEKLRKPVVGDVIWSAPTLLTLNPVGAPVAHVALHTSAVVHSYDTDTFLPPHAHS
jgi:uncharacterized membrane protein YeaQ/YmgE (transglycosylase-associated protein family)